MEASIFLNAINPGDKETRLRGIRALPLKDARVCVIITDIHHCAVTLYLDNATWMEIRKFFDGEPPTKKEDTNESVEN